MVARVGPFDLDFSRGSEVNLTVLSGLNRIKPGPSSLGQVVRTGLDDA